MYQNGGSDDYAGCIRLYFQYRSGSSYTLSSSYTGIYTCTIPDSQGSNLNVNIGIYNEDFSSKSEQLQFTCVILCLSV